MTPAMHYSGSIIGPRVCVYPGWAACCSGDRTIKLRAEGRVTPDRALVTCKRCLALIAGHDKWQADAPARRAAFDAQQSAIRERGNA